MNCQECGAVNLSDALFCASCGVRLGDALDPEQKLSWLVEDDADAATTEAPVAEPAPTSTEPADPAGAAAASGPPAAAATTTEVAGPPEQPPATSTIAAHRPTSTIAAGDTASAIGAGGGSGHPPAAAPDGPPDRPWLYPTVAVFVILALAVIGLLVVVSRDGDDSSEPTTPTVASTAPGATDPPTETTAPASTEPATTPAPDTTSPETTQPETTPPPTTAPELDDAGALELLGATVETDRPQVESFLERWVPQLSAKTSGTVWEGVTYDHVGIYELHEQLDAAYGALLIDGAEFVFRVDDTRMDGWFISIADVSFEEPNGALDWCADAGIDRENCAAKLITDRQDETSTLRLQP